MNSILDKQIADQIECKTSYHIYFAGSKSPLLLHLYEQDGGFWTEAEVYGMRCKATRRTSAGLEWMLSQIDHENPARRYNTDPHVIVTDMSAVDFFGKLDSFSGA